jgi:hypothetical protein
VCVFSSISFVPQIIQPISRFLAQRLIAKVKNEGVESCMFQGGVYGLVAGSSLGVTRVMVGVAWRSLKWIIGRGKAK